MDINPGELNKKIVIVQMQDDINENGLRETIRTVIRQCWASFRRTSMSEKIKNGAEMGETVCRFLVRYTPTLITRDMSIEYAGDVYDIQYVNDYEDNHEYIEIAALRREPGNG